MTNLLKRHLSPFSAAMLVAGNMIGIGIFVTASRIYKVLPNPGLIVLVWLIGGLLSLAGGLAYAEMASRFPRAGGGYVFLREAFGPFWGFLSGFSAGLVTIPETAAFLAMGMAKYAGITHPLWAKALGVSLIAAIAVINYRGVRQGARLQNSFMLLKFGLIFGLILAGFYSMNGDISHFGEQLPLSGPLWAMIGLALAAFVRMATAAADDGVRLLIISAYRDYAFQAALFADAERRYGAGQGSRWVAPPGHSEHHTGYAFDFADAYFPETDDEPSFVTTPAAQWLTQHAPAFGFTLSFPENNPQGVGYEPWHWRFAGTESASALFRQPPPATQT